MGNPETKIGKKTKNAVNNLLNNKLGATNHKIPEYIAILFDFICTKWVKTIRIDMAKWCDDRQYGVFKQMVISEDDDNAAKIDVICKIFHNANCIEIVNGFVCNQWTLGNLYKLLTDIELRQVFANLNMIKIETSPLAHMQERTEIHQNVRLYAQKFAEQGWNIQYDKQSIVQNVAKYVELIRTQQKLTKM